MKRKIWERTRDGVKLVTIPKKSDYKKGDEVLITKCEKTTKPEQNGKSHHPKDKKKNNDTKSNSGNTTKTSKTKN